MKLKKLFRILGVMFSVVTIVLVILYFCRLPFINVDYCVISMVASLVFSGLGFLSYSQISKDKNEQ